VSALYPAASPAATAWLATLRTILARLADQVTQGPPIEVETLAAALESESPEAAELNDALVAMLEEFESVVGSLAVAFGLVPSTMLIALGRGEEIGEIDPIVAAAQGTVAEIKALTSSGTVTIEKDGAATTLIAATTVATPIGPVRIPWPDRDDVWLCAVTATGNPASAAEAALERVLPHVGVVRAHIRTTPAPRRQRPGDRDHRPAVLRVALLSVDRAADTDLVMARLEGWRAALEQLHRGSVAIVWGQL
jgi:hypothetical protein